MSAGTGWDFFHWEKSDSVWTAEGTWQEHIPRTSDPNCGLVICLFGERVGEMLPGYFPWPEDLSRPDWATWPELEKGRVGVTGTLFELFDGLYGPRVDGAERRVVAIFKGAGNLLRAKALDPGDRKFGFEQEYVRLCGEARRPPRDTERAYDDQIDALDQVLRSVFLDEARPFYCFGRPDASPEDDLRELDALFERILPELLGAPRADASRREPKGLFSYGPDDHSIFFGRDDEVERALARLETLAARAVGPMLLLTGRSGEGKSSVMRAGLMGRLGAGLYADRCGAFVAVDRTVRSLVNGDPLLLLAEALEAALGTPLFDGHGLSDFVETARAGKLAAALRKALGARPSIAGHPARLFLGLDQLDDVVFEAEQDATLRDRLGLLLATVRDLCRAGLAWSVLTIPEDVIPRLDAVVPGLGLPAEALRPPGEDDLHHVISRSFGAFRLPPEDVPRLHDEAVEWLRGQKHPGPILPLISALMAEMKRAIAERRKASISADTPRDDTPLTLEGVLDRLGEKAWQQATRGVHIGWDERLGRLLRQLVVTSVGGGATRGLRTCPLAHPAVAEAGPLVDELQRQRFLYRPDGTSLRLTHEAIVAGWGRARIWYEGDREYQITLAEIEPKAGRWQADRAAGKPGHALTDPTDLEAAALLWMNYRHDTDLLPVDFLRASLLSLVDRFRTSGDFLGPKGLSYFRAALVINDADLLDAWYAAVDAADEPRRRAVIDHVHPETGKRALVAAATWGSARSVDWLLQRDADIRGAEPGGWTPLNGAAWSGRAETVRLLLDGSDLEARLDDGWSALHLAAQNGHAEVVTLLVRAQARVGVETDRNWTPLHLAASNGHAEVVTLLLAAQARVEAETKDKWTPLHLAASNGHAEVVALLLGAQARLEAETKDKWTPLHLAAEKGHAEVVTLLLWAQARVQAETKDTATPLHLAAQNGHAEVVTLLLGAQARVEAETDRKWTPLHLAARNGHAEVVTLLLGAQARVEAEGMEKFTPLHLAGASGHAEVVTLLLGAQAWVEAETSDKWSPLHLAAANGQAEVVALLLGAQARLEAETKDKWTPLHLAAEKGHAEVVELLLSAQARVEAESDRNWTPLHLAAQNGHADVVALLLGAQARVEAESDRNWTPLHLAAQNGHVEVVALLLDRAEVEARTDKGLTPLHLAAAKGHAKVVEFLLRSAAIEARTEGGLTALHYAAYGGHDTVLALLVQNADPNVMEISEGYTPLHYAVMLGHHGAAFLLLDGGARPDLCSKAGDDALAFAISLGRDQQIPRMRERHPDPATSEAAARRLLGDPEKGVLNIIKNAALGLPDDARDALKDAIRAAAPESFDAFCQVLEAAVLRLGGDPRYEIARLQALRRHPPSEAEAIAKAAVAASDVAPASAATDG